MLCSCRLITRLIADVHSSNRQCTASRPIRFRSVSMQIRLACMTVDEHNLVRMSEASVSRSHHASRPFCSWTTRHSRKLGSAHMVSTFRHQLDLGWEHRKISLSYLGQPYVEGGAMLGSFEPFSVTVWCMSRFHKQKHIGNADCSCFVDVWTTWLIN